MYSLIYIYCPVICSICKNTDDTSLLSQRSKCLKPEQRFQTALPCPKWCKICMIKTAKSTVKHMHVCFDSGGGTYWYQYIYWNLCPSCYAAVCFHIDFASISQLPYMLQGHLSAVYQKNSERSAFIRFKGINVQSGNSEACHVQLLLVSHSPGPRPAHLHELKPETHL